MDTQPQERETIFALASGAGVAGVSVIRLSGPAAAAVLQKLTGLLPPRRQAVLRALRDPSDGAIVDRALVLFMPGPHSFTGEDVVEFHVHGSVAVVNKMLSVLGAEEGCRPALAGEFTKRALMAGQLTFDQVEALGALLAAETERQRKQALAQFDCGLGDQAASWSEELLQHLALVEANIDFSDEGDVESEALGRARESVAALSIRIRNFIAQSRRARLIRDGITLAIAGPPNVGKSSLLNALVGQEMAIVSPVAGTTRDAIEVVLDLKGLKLRLIDTAGLRQTDDRLEAEGIRRAKERQAAADVVLLVDSEAERLVTTRAFNEGVCLRILSKCDDRKQDDAAKVKNLLPLSIHRPETIQTLLIEIAAVCEGLVGDGQSLALSDWGHQQVLQVDHALSQALGHPHWGAEPEIVAEHLRLALSALGVIAGHHGTEAMLDKLFATFCIGK